MWGEPIKASLGWDSKSLSVSPIPLDGCAQAFAEVGLGPEPKKFVGPSGVEAPPWLPVRLRLIPRDFSPEPGQLSNEVCQLFDGDFDAGPKIDWVRLIVPFRCQDDGVSAVLNIQEFPRGRSVTPTGKDRLRSRLRPGLSLYAFSYKSRNDMGALKIKIISRPVEIYRHEEDTIKAILLTISLRLNQQHLLGKPVGSVGLFRVTIP